jgi:hypothetical protein
MPVPLEDLFVSTQPEPRLKVIDQFLLGQHGNTLLHDPQSSSGPKQTQRIPYRSPKALPSMRTPPSDLFQVSQSKPIPTDEHPSLLSSSRSLHATQRPTPVCVPSNTVPLPPIGSDRRQREGSFNNKVGVRSESLMKLIPIPVSSPPGIPSTPRKSLLPGHRAAVSGFPRFFYILAANKRKNPHAPLLVSKFNPLRDYVPSCAWLNRSFPLPSARFRTPFSLLPPRCRSYVRSRCLSCGAIDLTFL